MIFRTPLGLLGLLALIVLVIIYIIKQNFQQRILPSTYIWRQSFKYHKKRLPVSKFRNLLIFLCQVLALTACAFILARPLIADDISSAKNEKILIIDAAANMLAVQEDGLTRFEHAVHLAQEDGIDAISKTGLVTVILAGTTAKYQITRTDSKEEFVSAMQELILPNDQKCSYGVADISAAMLLAEAVLTQNALSQVIFYTATTYVNAGNVEVVNVDEFKLDWNVSILNAEEKRVDNFYLFEIEVASYNKDMPIAVEVGIRDAVTIDNDSVETKHTVLNIVYNIVCSGGKSEFIEVDERITEYSDVRISILEDDSFVYDNEMYLYGSKKETIKVLYTSSALNPFVDAALMSVRQKMSNHWNIDIKTYELRDSEFILEGYDFYVFEHEMPRELPIDGFSLVINPDVTSVGMGLIIGEQFQLEGQGGTLISAEKHQVTDYVNVEDTLITRYMQVSAYEDFTPLIYFDNGNQLDPVLLVKNQLMQRTAVLAFSVHYSDLPVLVGFPILMYNIFNYFMPTTVSSHLYEVGETIQVNSRGIDLKVSGAGLTESYQSMDDQLISASINPPSYGTYTIEQTLISGAHSEQTVFVRIPKSESDFAKFIYELPNPYVQEGVGMPLDFDLIIILSSILVGLLFVEWWLHNREQI